MIDTDNYLHSKNPEIFTTFRYRRCHQSVSYHTTQIPNLNIHKDDTCVNQAYVPTTDNCAAAQVAIWRLATRKARVRFQVSPAELSVDEVALRQVFLQV
jgi:hypothetical protein